MSELEKLRQEIETARKKLDRKLEKDGIENHYQASVALDRLIEQYLDLRETP
jgi:uncharacterized membrane-anchored protein YhcB (DUF1043 family)